MSYGVSGGWFESLLTCRYGVSGGWFESLLTCMVCLVGWFES